MEAKLEIAKIEAIEPGRLLGRMWSTLDSDADGKLSWRELSYSGFGVLLGQWEQLDTAQDRCVSAEERSAFFSKLRQDKGDALYRKVPGSGLW